MLKRNERAVRQQCSRGTRGGGGGSASLPKHRRRKRPKITLNGGHDAGLHESRRFLLGAPPCDDHAIREERRPVVVIPLELLRAARRKKAELGSEAKREKGARATRGHARQVTPCFAGPALGDDDVVSLLCSETRMNVGGAGIALNTCRTASDVWDGLGLASLEAEDEDATP